MFTKSIVCKQLCIVDFAGVERSPSPIQHSQSYTPLSSERRGSFETPKLRRAQSDVGSSRVANRYAVDNGQIPLIPEVARTTPGPGECGNLYLLVEFVIFLYLNILYVLCVMVKRTLQNVTIDNY